MSFIKIKNAGLIEQEAFTLIGASTKRDDSSKIGFFGSGLKYSLAVLLRNKVGFKIFSGLQEIKVDTFKTEFRGQTFNQISINGVATGFTMEMGIDWKSWFPIREIYCNALDEAHGSIQEVSEVAPVDSETHFYIEKCDAISEIMENWNDYFTNKREDKVLDAGEFKAFIGSDSKCILYRRGVQCWYVERKRCLYHYDYKDFVVNEGRTLIADGYYHICQMLAKHANKSMIKNIFDNYKDKVEEEMYWSMFSFNTNWLDVIDGRRLVKSNIAGYYAQIIMSDQSNYLILPGRLVDGLKRCFGSKITILGDSSDSGDHVVIDKTPAQEQKITQALSFLFDAGIAVAYPIAIAVFPSETILGSVVMSSKTILLAPTAFDHGQKKLVEVIVEEYFHIKSGAGDFSRGFQDFLINNMVSMMEERAKVYL